MVNLYENLIIIGFDEQLLPHTLPFVSSAFYTILDELTLISKLRKFPQYQDLLKLSPEQIDERFRGKAEVNGSMIDSCS